MYYEIDAQGHEFDYLLEDLRDALSRINNFDANDRRSRLRRCWELVQQIKTVRSVYVSEMRVLEDQDIRLRYNESLKERNASFKNLVAALEIKKNEIDREQLNTEAIDMENPNTENMTSHQVITQGDRTQDKTQDAVDRMKKQVAEAEEIGIATAAKMDTQIAQMGQVTENLNDIQYNIHRAKQTAKTMARNAASDRCIQVLCGSIFICIVIIIVLMATR